MRTWVRIHAPGMKCGCCARALVAGDAMMKRSKVGDGYQWEQIRCAACAGEPVPDDLAPLAPRADHRPLVPVRFSADSLPLDWKQQQSGDAK